MATRQDRSHTLIVIAILGVLALESIEIGTSPTANPSNTVETDVVEYRPLLTGTQQDLLEFGLSRFAEHGLALPTVHVEFYPTVADCKGHKGSYTKQTRTVRMCTLDKTTMLHELAHAWANLNLSDVERAAFAAHRGLVAWNDQGDPWHDRGTEHAAEIVAWALTDKPNAIRSTFLSDDGTPQSTFRLFSIENSSVEALHDGFVQLTGMEPIFRSPQEWDSQALEAEWQAKVGAMSSPELNR